MKHIKLKFLSVGDEFIFNGKTFLIVNATVAINVETDDVLTIDPECWVIPK